MVWLEHFFFGQVHLPSYAIIGIFGVSFLALNAGAWSFLIENKGDWELGLVEFVFSTLTAIGMGISVAIAIGARAFNTEYENLDPDYANETDHLTAEPIVKDRFSRNTERKIIKIFAIVQLVILFVVLILNAVVLSDHDVFTKDGDAPQVLAAQAIAGAVLGIIQNLVVIFVTVKDIYHPILKPMFADSSLISLWLLGSAAGIFAYRIYEEAQTRVILFAITDNATLMTTFAFTLISVFAWIFGLNVFTI